MSSSMSYMQIKGIAKRYGTYEAVRGIDIDIAEREFVVIVGPSGCGKSTLLRMIAGLETISRGDLVIDGQRMNDVRPADRGIAMVFQSYALYPHKTVEQNMGFALKVAKTPKDEVARKIARAAEILQLGPLMKRLPKELSGGQRQRVAIGRAIVRNPKVFLFDEPLSNLDASLRLQMRIELAQLHRELQATMVYVTHDQIEAMTLATRIVVCDGGEGLAELACRQPVAREHRLEGEQGRQVFGAGVAQAGRGHGGSLSKARAKAHAFARRPRPDPHEPPRHRCRKTLRLGGLLPFRQRGGGGRLPAWRGRRRRRAHPGDQPVPQLQVHGHRLLRVAAGRGARAQGDPERAHHQRPAPAFAVRHRHRGPQHPAGQVPAGRLARRQ